MLSFFSRITFILIAIACSALAGQPHLSTTTPEPQGAIWLNRHEAKLIEARTKTQPDMVLIGDSITQALEANSALTSRIFPGKTILNLGFSADRTENVLWRLQNGALDGLDPKLIMILIGTNNTGLRKDPPQITAKAIGLIVDMVRMKCPNSKILLLSILPREESPEGPLRKLNAQVNELLPALADNQHVFHEDLNAALLDAQGRLPANIMPDFLHPSPAGQEIWMEALKPVVERLLGSETPAVPDAS
jgi:lysophospholipase L1-like esterase